MLDKGLRVFAVSIYLPLWLGMGLLTGLLLIDGAPTLVVYLTLGLGLVLLPVPTIFLYMTAALPGVLLVAFGLPWWLGAGVGGFGALWLGVYPPFAAQGDALAARNAFTADDREVALPQAPRQLRIVRWGGNRPQPEAALRHAPCEALCQRLLYGSEVEAVEVLAYDDDADDPSLPVTWRRLSQDRCPSAFENARDALPEVQRAVATGDCLVPSVGEALPGAPWVRIQRIQHGRMTRRAQDSRWTHTTKAFVVTAGPDGEAYEDPPYRQHAVEIEVVRPPLALVPESHDPRRMDLTWWTDTTRHGVHEPLDVARTLFGYRLAALGSPGEPTTSGSAAPAPGLGLVQQLLEQPGDEPFDASQSKLVREALVAVRGRDHLSPSQVALVQQLLRDPRIDDVYFVVDVIRKDAEATRTLLPALVDRMGMVPHDGQGHSRGRIARFLAQQPLPHLRPHADALLAAAEADPSWATNGLLPVLPLIVQPPPVELLAARLGDEHTKTAQAALVGLCNTDPRLLSPELLATAEETARRVGFERALAAMARIWEAQGEIQRSTALLASLDERDQHRVKRQLAQFADGPPVPGGCRL